MDHTTTNSQPSKRGVPHWFPHQVPSTGGFPGTRAPQPSVRNTAAALEKGPVRQRDAAQLAIWKSLYILQHESGVKRIVFQWIPAYYPETRDEQTRQPGRHSTLTVRYQNIVAYYKEKSKAYHQAALQTNHNT